MDRQERERLVAQVKQALSHRSAPVGNEAGQEHETTPPPRLITEAVVRDAARTGETTLRVAPGAIVTPLARDALRERGIALASALPSTLTSHERRTRPSSVVSSSRSPSSNGMVAIGVVPTARTLEPVLVSVLRRAYLTPVRVPTSRRDAAHLARQVAGAVAGGQATRGVIVDETGLVGTSIANRLGGVVAATCADPLTARWAAERLGANVICVPGDLVAPALLDEIVSTWLQSPCTTAPDVAAALRELDGR